MILSMSDERKYAKTLGRTVRALRGTKTQKEVAKAAGLPVSTLSKIEQARQIPRSETFAKIAHGLGLSAVQLEQRVMENTLGAIEQTEAGGALAFPTVVGRRRAPEVDMSGLPRSAALRLASTLGTIASLRSHIDTLELDIVSLTHEFRHSAPEAPPEE